MQNPLLLMKSSLLEKKRGDFKISLSLKKYQKARQQGDLSSFQDKYNFRFENKDIRKRQGNGSNNKEISFSKKEARFYFGRGRKKMKTTSSENRRNNEIGLI